MGRARSLLPFGFPPGTFEEIWKRSSDVVRPKRPSRRSEGGLRCLKWNCRSRPDRLPDRRSGNCRKEHLHFESRGSLANACFSHPPKSRNGRGNTLPQGRALECEYPGRGRAFDGTIGLRPRRREETMTISRRDVIRLAALGHCRLSSGRHALARGQSAHRRPEIRHGELGTRHAETSSFRRRQRDRSRSRIFRRRGCDQRRAAGRRDRHYRLRLAVGLAAALGRRRPDASPLFDRCRRDHGQAGLPIRTIPDLKDKKIGVAGGPLDKSWLLIQALARRDHGLDLAASNEIVFGAPPLLRKRRCRASWMRY